MTETARDRANRAQLHASDPEVSAFVAASAGSGKTKLLTDRLLRLMLTGSEPERIQCLTFTKAAAAEMALRLQRTLGRWVTLPAERLREDLARLQIEPTEAACRTARALFARVLDLPGGMRIGMQATCVERPHGIAHQQETHAGTFAEQGYRRSRGWRDGA